MRRPVITLLADSETGEYFVALQHEPGCDCGETDSLYKLPVEAAQAIAVGTGKILKACGEKVEGGEKLPARPEVPRPSELDDADRR